MPDESTRVAIYKPHNMSLDVWLQIEKLPDYIRLRVIERAAIVWESSVALQSDPKGWEKADIIALEMEGLRHPTLPGM